MPRPKIQMLNTHYVVQTNRTGYRFSRSVKKINPSIKSLETRLRSPWDSEYLIPGLGGWLRNHSKRRDLHHRRFHATVLPVRKLPRFLQRRGGSVGVIQQILQSPFAYVWLPATVFVVVGGAIYWLTRQKPALAEAAVQTAPAGIQPMVAAPKAKDQRVRPSPAGKSRSGPRRLRSRTKRANHRLRPRSLRRRHAALLLRTNRHRHRRQYSPHQCRRHRSLGRTGNPQLAGPARKCPINTNMAANT